MKGHKILCLAGPSWGQGIEPESWIEKVREILLGDGWVGVNLPQANRVIFQLEEELGTRDEDWIWLTPHELWFKDARKALLFKLAHQEIED